MKILSWNVNGIRAVVKKGFLDFLRKENPDILCLQEIKIDEKAILREEFDFPDYTEYWNPAERKGYSGTAVLVRGGAFFSRTAESFFTTNGLGVKEFDIEGRVQTLEFKGFYLVNAYFPNANHELSRLDYKLRFDEALLKYCRKLKKKKPVVICGDFNVAHKDIDLARPKDNEGNAGFTGKEREWMTRFLRVGFVDTFRYFYPHQVQYSWWTYKFKARERNIGWRIDYFCVSAGLIECVSGAFILNKVVGSDHCPVGIDIEL